MMAALSGIGERVARLLGRVPVILLFRGTGISLLVSMALLQTWAAPADPFRGPNATAFAANSTLTNGVFCFDAPSGNASAAAAPSFSSALSTALGSLMWPRPPSTGGSPPLVVPAPLHAAAAAAPVRESGGGVQRLSLIHI